MPGQKLKVKIPKKADMEKRNFVVSVPAPKVKAPEPREKNFRKEFKEALHDYSGAFDEWCVAEGSSPSPVFFPHASAPAPPNPNGCAPQTLSVS